jgi:carbon monoxide dehydrogenase subunit G
MQLDHRFTVKVPVDRAWAVLTDVERIAPCLPGAQLTGVDGDAYTGHVKVKVGPIVAQFAGKATFVERDDAAHVAVLRGEGRDTGGKGSASATITASLADAGNGETECTVRTDLTISGKVAQFGRGALADVSDKLLAQFVANLDALIAADPDGGAPTSGAPKQPDTAPVDLLAVAGAPVLKRLVPVLLVVAAVAAVVIGALLR